MLRWPPELAPGRLARLGCCRSVWLLVGRTPSPRRRVGARDLLLSRRASRHGNRRRRRRGRSMSHRPSLRTRRPARSSNHRRDSSTFAC
ncbi:hypothetical protein DB30_04475 [Enhygromyxa salina]|uniref:Uncharacterized protein n=1 Tax=Enhygromyxa salina TaxID=215803 RepID=A0A0C2CZM3_9BACT|nr:hypothetical protein DB30_04475 [Enhygromyxa salina]